MIGLLLIKDLRRAWRNPWPTIIFLAIPLCITGLIGLAFGPKSASGGLGRIQVAVVDEDESVLGDLLEGALGQGEATQHFEPRLAKDRSEAARWVEEDEVSAAVIIPAGFTKRFFMGEHPPPIELIKNPARSYHPAVVEELLGVVAEALSAIAQLFESELPAWRALIESEDSFDFREAGRLLERAGERLERAGPFLDPPLISYTKDTRAAAKEKSGSERAGTTDARVEIFGFVLPGMAAMFLLMIGDGATRDLYKEVRFRTLDRFRTLCPTLLPVVVAKIIYSIVLTLAGAAIIFGAGGWIFGLNWNRPIWLGLVVVAYALCAGGFMSLLAALARSEKRADVTNSLAVFGMAFLGGSMVPLDALPGFVERWIAPAVPTYWFIEAVHHLIRSGVDSFVLTALPILAVSGVLMAALATWHFNGVLRKGMRE